MVDGLGAVVVCPGVKVHEVTDEVLGGFRHIVPVRRVKLVDLLEQLGIVLVVEWRVAAETAMVEVGSR